jgi:hypothetical protein
MTMEESRAKSAPLRPNRHEPPIDETVLPDLRSRAPSSAKGLGELSCQSHVRSVQV